MDYALGKGREGGGEEGRERRGRRGGQEIGVTAIFVAT